ncbi:MAG: hypothetical protein Q4G52_05585 [Clostridia bacterium]|nr:hypothetical protein [Clostridia bacterium]
MTDPDGRRAEHIDVLRRTLRGMRRATRSQLAKATGLSVMTVGKLLAVMEQRGEVREAGQVASGGRPSSVASYDGDYAHFATVCVQQRDGRSAFEWSVYNLFGERIEGETLLLDRVDVESFDVFFDKAKAQGYRLRLAVFALPGEAEGDRLFISDFEALMGERFLPRIRERYRVETLFENDVNAAALGYASEAGENGVCAGIYLPRRFPPGAGLIVGGSILHGHGHFAGEIAYIHGVRAWMALDYGDAERVLAMLSELLVALACVAAPENVVLYGDFLTEETAKALEGRVKARLEGKFAMRIACRTDMAPDMERGAAQLGLRRMETMLREADKGEWGDPSVNPGD